MQVAATRLRAPQSSRYRVLRRIGQGGMGVVYEAYDRERQERVALKTIPRVDADLLLRLKNEFHALLDLHHPNLVDLGELVAEGQQWFFTMELVEGVDFLTWIRRGEERSGLPTMERSGDDTLVSGPPVEAGIGPLDERMFQHLASPSGAARPDVARLRAAMAQLASALDALHRASTIHRDVKPSNVLVTPEGRLVLLDYGLALDLLAQGAAADAGSIVGTVDYMAPEQAGSRDIGPTADWYAAGTMLFEALTGHLPFRGSGVEVIVSKQLREPPPPSRVAPGVPDDLDRLCTDLLRRLPAARPPGWEVLRRLGVEETSDVRARASDPARPSFVGREPELAGLHAAAATLAEGGGGVVCVAGPSGVGKTTLVTRFLRQLCSERPETVVLSGRCYERDSVPFKAVDGVIDALVHHLRSLPKQDVRALLPEDVALLPLLFPVLARVEAIAATGRLRTAPAEPQAQRARAFVTLRALLDRLARRAPLVITIDDAQWADADSLALLAEVLAPPETPPFLLLATVRTEHPDDAARLAASLPVAVPIVSLDTLRSDDATELARLLLATSGRDDAEASDIAREAGGHPLFIDELVRHLVGGDTARAGLRLDDAIAARVARLEATPRAVLEVVAAATRRPAIGLIAAAAEVPIGDVVRCLSVLRAGKLVRTAGTRRTDGVEPYHDRVREAVLTSLRPETLAFWNRRLALAIETSGQGDAEAEALAFHWANSGEHERARRYAVRAAEEAVAALAFDRAARLYGVALELRAGGAGERARLLAGRAAALAHAGRGPEAADAYLEAAGAAAPAEQVELRRLAGEQLLRSGHVDRGIATIRGVLDAVGVSLPETPRRALFSLLYHRARLRLRGLGWRERDPATVTPAELRRIDTCWSVGMGLGMVDTVRGADFQTRNVLLALESGEPRRIARALALEAGFVSTAGGPAADRASQLLARARALAERLEDPMSIGFVAATDGVVSSMTGRWSEALAAFERAEGHLLERCTGVTWELDSVRQFTLTALYCVGSLSELCRRVPLLARDADRRGDLLAATHYRTGIAAMTWLFADDPAGMRATVAEAMSRWSQHGYHAQHWYETMALVAGALYEGDASAALQAATGRWAQLERSMLTRVQIVRLGAADVRARAELAAGVARGGSDGAALVRSAERRARGILGERMRWGSNLAHLVLAGVAMHRGDPDGALRELDDARAGFALDGARMFDAAALWRRGELLGGDEGRTLVAQARAAIEREGVRNPTRFVAMLAPVGPA